MKKLLLTMLIAACANPPEDPIPDPDCTTAFAWDVPDDLSVVDGYRFYIGSESRDYTDTVELSVQHEYRMESAECGKEYFVAVTAFNEHGESDFSDEVRFIAGEKDGAE